MTDEPYSGHSDLTKAPNVKDIKERKYLFPPKDEEPPKPGENYWDQFPRMPVVTRVQVQVDVQPMAQFIDPMVQNHDLEGVVTAWKKAKIVVDVIPNTTIVRVRVTPRQ